MPAQVSPPNPVMEFVQANPNSGAQRLSPVAFRFLTNITQALLGQPLFTAPAGPQIAQFSLGAVTLSTGDLANPNGQIPGNIGDIFISTDGSSGGILFGKTSGVSGSTVGWSLIT